MLILKRRPGETIMIGDSIVITALGYEQGQMRIGIAAPKSIPVHRTEIYDRIQVEQKNQTEEKESHT